METTFEIEASTVYHKFGVTEDGEDFIGEVFYIVATDADGYRFTHELRFSTVYSVEPEHEDDYGFRSDTGAKNSAELFASLLPKTFDPDDSACWEESRPCYGSPAYIKSGQGYIDKQQEIADDLGYEEESFCY